MAELGCLFIKVPVTHWSHVDILQLKRHVCLFVGMSMPELLVHNYVEFCMFELVLSYSINYVNWIC